MVELNT